MDNNNTVPPQSKLCCRGNDSSELKAGPVKVVIVLTCISTLTIDQDCDQFNTLLAQLRLSHDNLREEIKAHLQALDSTVHDLKEQITHVSGPNTVSEFGRFAAELNEKKTNIRELEARLRYANEQLDARALRQSAAEAKLKYADVEIPKSPSELAASQGFPGEYEESPFGKGICIEIGSDERRGE